MTRDGIRPSSAGSPSSQGGTEGPVQVSGLPWSLPSQLRVHLARGPVGAARHAPTRTRDGGHMFLSCSQGGRPAAGRPLLLPPATRGPPMATVPGLPGARPRPCPAAHLPSWPRPPGGLGFQERVQEERITAQSPWEWVRYSIRPCCLGALGSQQQAARGHVGVFPPLGLTSRPSGSLKGPLLPARLSIPAGHAGTQVLGALPVTHVSGAAPRDPGDVAWPGAGASVDTALWPCLGAMRVLSCSQLCSRQGAIFHKDAAPELVTTCTVDTRDAPRQRQRVLARWGGRGPIASHRVTDAGRQSPAKGDPFLQPEGRICLMYLKVFS